MTYRIRFGIKGSTWLFPNAGIIAFDGDNQDRIDMGNLADMLRKKLKARGLLSLADRVFFEAIPQGR